ncbi:MAG: F0F1 ATP synthase subunit A [Candidatus Riflebacteria bacterium]|nr:F0F1 ATP synthase subunit A [Candidatus Riflebacteria bacterium]
MPVLYASEIAPEAAGAAGAAAHAAHAAEETGHAVHACGHAEGSWLHPFSHATGLPDYILITWLLLVLLVVVSVVGTRRLHLAPRGLQNVLEYIFESLEGFVCGIMGPERGRIFTPLLGTFFLFILCNNLAGLVPGLLSPTAYLNTTLSLAIVAFLMVQYHGIKAHGAGRYFAHFMGEPLWLAPLMLPVHLIGEFAKPLSLAIRLFGNIFGEDKVIAILVGFSPVLLFIPVPVQFPMMLFGIFTSFVQALVFTTLTAIYLTVATEHAESGEHAVAHGHN